MPSAAKLTNSLGLLAIILVACVSSGCSISKAITQPDKKDLSVFMPGNARSEVIAEVGSPSYQENIDGVQRDVFTFQQGYSRPVKIGRAVGHGFGLFATFGLWELAGYPIELALDGEDVRVQVDYDREMVVSEVTYFRGGHLRENGPTLPAELYGGSANKRDETITLTRGTDGNTIVMRGAKLPPRVRDETFIQDTKIVATVGDPTQTQAPEKAPEEVNEATYYSSSEAGTGVRAAQTSTRLR
jgi:hypothetical protein